MDSRYRLRSRPTANPAAVVRGDTYRFTVLTDGLIRLEYAADGKFEDRASTLALFRDLPVPEFRVIEDHARLEIVTDRVHLVYDRGPFSTSGLSIQVLGNISVYHSVWRYGEIPEDLGGTARTLDEADGAVPLGSGVISRTGFAVLDDSRTLVFDDDGWVAPRNPSRTDFYFFGYGWVDPDHFAAYLLDVSGHGVGAFSVAVIDIDWHLTDVDPRYGSGWTGYTWNGDLFPDPAAFLSQLGNPYDAVGADSDGRTSIDWGVYGVPETFIVDAKGVIRFKHTGPLNMDDIDREIVPAIARAKAAG